MIPHSLLGRTLNEITLTALLFCLLSFFHFAFHSNSNTNKNEIIADRVMHINKLRGSVTLFHFLLR